MILSLLLSLALPQDVPADPAAQSEQEQEIVVIARRLKDWRGTVNFRNGKASCKVRRSTGDKQIDKIGCDAMVQCFSQFMPRFEATRDKALSADARKQMTDATNRDLAACVEARHETLSAELADRRVAGSS